MIVCKNAKKDFHPLKLGRKPSVVPPKFMPKHTLVVIDNGNEVRLKFL